MRRARDVVAVSLLYVDCVHLFYILYHQNNIRECNRSTYHATIPAPIEKTLLLSVAAGCGNRPVVPFVTDE